MRFVERLPSPEGRELYLLRIQADITQVELGHRIGVGSSTIASWELGRARPTAHWINKVCDVFNVDSATREIILDLRYRTKDWDPVKKKKRQSMKAARAKRVKRDPEPLRDETGDVAQPPPVPVTSSVFFSHEEEEV